MQHCLGSLSLNSDPLLPAERAGQPGNPVPWSYFWRPGLWGVSLDLKQGVLPAGNPLGAGTPVIKVLFSDSECYAVML